MERNVREIILQRRKQMAVHSCLYYMMDESIVSDDQWQRWADELERLQNAHPEFMKIGFMDSEFRDWTGATGAHLNHRHPWTRIKAERILEYHNRVNKSVNNHL
jgi:NAD-dependent DNA ligase